ncbi:MAG: biopolymer transporter ExbD [Phycisphaeraceae bacterium]|nr:biopolymer transporter ExbD [Phycisphaeraceae bacterium]
MRPLASNAAHASHASGHINVTPLIDVVMVMIVFFLIVGKLASDQISQLDLPPAVASPPAPEPGVVIVNIPADSTIIVFGESLTPDGLRTRLREALATTPDLIVQIRADRSLTYASIAPIIESCRAEGVSRVRLSTEGEP